MDLARSPARVLLARRGRPGRQQPAAQGLRGALAIRASEPPDDTEGKYWQIPVARTMLPEIGQGCIMKPL